MTHPTPMMLATLIDIHDWYGLGANYGFAGRVRWEKGLARRGLVTISRDEFDNRVLRVTDRGALLVRQLKAAKSGEDGQTVLVQFGFSAPLVHRS